MAKQATLRKLAELLGEDFLDVPLVVDVRDSRGNSELIPLELDASHYPRQQGSIDGAEPSLLRLWVSLDQHKLHVLPAAVKRSA